MTRIPVLTIRRAATLVAIAALSGLPGAGPADGPGDEPSRTGTASRRETPRPPAQKPVDYRTPARSYKSVRVGGLTVAVEAQLLASEPETARRALERLSKKVAEALEALPAAARPALKAIPIVLMFGPKAHGGGRDNGLEYFRETAPDFHDNLDPRWRHVIVVYCAKNYMDISDLWALKALVHEYAHAHQIAHWPDDQPEIVQAWENAVARGLYRNVEDNEGKTHERGYALVNQLEYFAELSCMYFARCNYPPVDRAALEAYDPVGYQMIRRFWNLDVSAKAKSKTKAKAKRP
jgi:hypothetical protein